MSVVDGQTNAVYFIRTDHIGRPVFATDDTGVKVWEVTYEPFGTVHVSTGGPIDLRFPGQWFQTESGLHQNWMREYDPTTGRYIQADPLGLVDGASVYGYALQNPGLYVDPRGEFVWLVPLGGAIAGAAVSGILQYGINSYYGDMELDEALGCIDLIPVATGAAFGANGLGLVRLLLQGRWGGAGISAATSGSFNSSVPSFYWDEGECGCEIEELPTWIVTLRNLAIL